MASPKEGDVRSGLTGLIVGALLILALVTVIVRYTTAKYEKAEAAVEAPKP